MRIWNYRVVVHNIDNKQVYKIHKVFYNKEGVPIDYDTNFFELSSCSIKEMIWNIDKIKIALKKPVLEVSIFKNKFQNDRTFYNS
jgi:hypothetical protein